MTNDDRLKTSKNQEEKNMHLRVYFDVIIFEAGNELNFLYPLIKNSLFDKLVD